MKCRTYKCKARCCYNIPFESGELEKYADKIVNPVLDTMPLGPAVVAITSEIRGLADLSKNKCPFLRADYLCNIYENRPEICRKFGIIKELPCGFLKQ